MRDGATLATDVYRPDTAERCPTLVMRLPYNKEVNQLLNFSFDVLRGVQAGYVVVSQDTRGRYASEGEFNPFFDEGQDGADTIAWAAAPAVVDRSRRHDRRVVLRRHAVDGGYPGAGGLEGHRPLRHDRPVLRVLGLSGRSVPARVQPALDSVLAGARGGRASHGHRRRHTRGLRLRAPRRGPQRRAVRAPPVARGAGAEEPGSVLRRVARPPELRRVTGSPLPPARPTSGSRLRPSTWAGGTTCSSKEHWPTIWA